MKAAPKLSDERVRQILAYACEQRDVGTLFVTVMASELESLAQESVDKRTALLVLNARLDELENQSVFMERILASYVRDPRERAELVRRMEAAGVSKSSPKNDRVDAGKSVHAPVRK